MDHPKPDADLLPGLFDYLDAEVGVVEETLRTHFPVEERRGHEVIVFGDASHDDFLEALHESPPQMVPFFMKVTGLTRRVFSRVYGIDHIDQIKGWEEKDLRQTERGKTLAKAAKDLLPEEMYLETALFSFYKMWEADKRRTFRRDYEQVILDRLREVGYQAVKDESIEGKPDLAIPENGPYQVLGKVRAVDIDDFQKRAKNFRDEAAIANTNHPGAKFVAVAKLPRHQLERRREELRSGLEAGNIDLVVFQDELDMLFDRLANWGVSKGSEQVTFQDLDNEE